MLLKRIVILTLSFLLVFPLNAIAYESLSFLFAGNTTTYIRTFERTQNSLKTVCPDYFEINSNGTLRTTIKADPLFVQYMQAKKVKVIPYLSNNWDRKLGQAAINNREIFTAQLAAKVVELGCDGVSVDIQNLTDFDRDEHTDFIRLLREALPDDKILHICVAPNPWAGTKGWQGSYDYKALGEMCDVVFIMAYDEHYSGGLPGAVASFSFVEKSVKYAINYVPSEKIVLGVPFYGRYWQKGAPSGGKGITVADVERLVSTYDAVTWYDEKAECARATLNITDGDNAVIWGNSRLSTGTYDIWYENQISIEKKISLVSKYNLLGAGSWALGQEPDHFWDNYSVWLLGLPFTDIENHWAQSYIIELNGKGIINGKPGKKFDPDGELTRAEAAALMVKLTGLENEISDRSFADTNNHWAKDTIAVAMEYEILKGYDNNMFYPDKKITREEFAVICDRVLFAPETVNFSQKLYTDVSPETNIWSNKSIVLLSMNGILNGYDDGSFAPKKTITRGEATKVILSMMEFPGGFSVAPGVIKTPQPIEPH